MIKDSSKIISVDRLERKWAIGGDLDINTFFIAIYRSSFVFTESYKPRSVNTIYFDDADYSSITYYIFTIPNAINIRHIIITNYAW